MPKFKFCGRLPASRKATAWVKRILTMEKGQITGENIPEGGGCFPVTLRARFRSYIPKGNPQSPVRQKIQGFFASVDFELKFLLYSDR